MFCPIFAEILATFSRIGQEKIMANPKKRRTKSAAGRNRSHLALKSKTLNKCPKCGLALRPHTACAFCGTYKGRAVIAVKGKTAKKKTEKK